MGAPIGSQSISVAAGEDEVFAFPWMPPNPDDYASFGADKAHFCLLARIETEASSPFGMSSPETSNLYANVRDNNNIVWKNITVLGPSGSRRSQLIVADFSGEGRRQALRFDAAEERDLSIFKWGRIFAWLPPRLLEQVEKEKWDGIERVEERKFEILEPGATIGLFELGKADVHVLEVSTSCRSRARRWSAASASR